MNDKNSGLSQDAGFGARNPTSPSAVDVEREPMPARSPEPDSDEQTMPPARSGPAAETGELPTEGDTDDNPVHHTGHMPPPVTANRD